MLFSVVVPVYNSEKSLEELYARIKNEFENVIKQDFELVLVDDSSKDGSFAIMKKLRMSDARVKIIQLAKNFGQHSALLCGFQHSKGDMVITLDDDLQHPPEEIHKLVDYLSEYDECDIVIGNYISKKHSRIRNFGTWLSKKVTAAMFHCSSDIDLTSFRLMRRFVVDAICMSTVSYPRIGHLLVAYSNRIANVSVNHDERKYGRSGYTFSRLVRDFFSNIFNQSNFPLIFIQRIGVFSCIFSFLLGVYYLIRYFSGRTSVKGWTTVIILILFFFGMTLFAIGLVGQYLIRILNESKKEPNYIVRLKEVE